MNNDINNAENILDEVSKFSVNVDEEPVYKSEFSLTKAEAFEGLKKSGMIKTVDRRLIIYIIILVVAIVLFLLTYFKNGDINNLIFAVISLVILIIMAVVPSVYLSRLAKENANGNIIHFELYKDSIHILCNKNKWYIPLNDTNGVKFCNSVIIIKRFSDNQLFLIPLRAIKEEKFDEVTEIIRLGTFGF